MVDVHCHYTIIGDVMVALLRVRLVSRGFTLLKLLIVISVISVLMGRKGVRNLFRTGRGFSLAFCGGVGRAMPCPRHPGPRQAESCGDGAACGGGPAAMPTNAVSWRIREAAGWLPDWVGRVHRPQTRQEREAVALCIVRGRPT